MAAFFLYGVDKNLKYRVKAKAIRRERVNNGITPSSLLEQVVNADLMVVKKAVRYAGENSHIRMPRAISILSTSTNSGGFLPLISAILASISAI